MHSAAEHVSRRMFPHVQVGGNRLAMMPAFAQLRAREGGQEREGSVSEVACNTCF